MGTRISPRPKGCNTGGVWYTGPWKFGIKELPKVIIMICEGRQNKGPACKFHVKQALLKGACDKIFTNTKRQGWAGKQKLGIRRVLRYSSYRPWDHVLGRMPGHKIWQVSGVLLSVLLTAVAS